MMSAPIVLPAVNLDLTIGALLVGTYLSTTLFGFTSLQTYSYFNNYSDDRKFLKILVAAVWTLEFVHTIFITRAFYEMSVNNFGNFQDFVRFPFVLKFSIVWSNFIACAVQAFFANRIRIMSKRWELAIVCWTLSVLRHVFSIVATAEEIKVGRQDEFNAQFKWIIVFVLAVGAGNDVLIAGGLTFYLGRNKRGIVNTNRVINRLIKFTIQSGLFTSIVATVMLICYLCMPDNFIWLSLFVFLAKTYSNSFLATLNARKNLRSDLVGSSAIVLGTTNNSDADMGSGRSSTRVDASGFSNIDAFRSKPER